MNCYKKPFLVAVSSCAALASLSYAQDKKAAPAVTPASYAESKEWPTYGHDSGGMRYSPLTQITPANVSDLKVAWTYHLKPEGYVAPAGGRGGRGGGRGPGGPDGAPGGRHRARLQRVRLLAALLPVAVAMAPLEAAAADAATPAFAPPKSRRWS